MNRLTRPTPGYAYAIGVFVISQALLLFNLSRAPMMFDESFYVRAAREFLAGQPTSNAQHPPLAKYFIAASIRAFGDTPFAWRFPSTLAGGIIATAIFAITFRLTRNRRTAIVAWLLTIAGGFWFVMSRLAALSPFELAFELAGVWIFLIAIDRASTNRSPGNRTPTVSAAISQPARPNDSLRLFALAGILLGLSVGCRWCGIIGLIACLIVALIERARLQHIAVMLAAALAAYILIWIPLLAREHKPLSSIVGANLYIYRFHHYAPADPHLGEPWWTWIFRLQPKPSLSYLVANPVIGALGLFAIVALLAQRFVRHQADKSYILSLLYLGHLGQWIVGVRPQTFYYYYFEAFTMLAPALAIAIQGLEWRKLRADALVTACAFLFFLYWYPTWANLPEPFNLLTGAH